LRHSSPTPRAITLTVAAATVAAFGVASMASYRPDGVTDRSLAREALKQALVALDDKAGESTARMAAYRAKLNTAEGFLRHALRVNPTDTSSIQRLAMVRWELGVLDGAPDTDPILSLVQIAAERAPQIPEIQADLGSLFYRMGNQAEAAPFMRRTLELSPSMTDRVVALMKEGGVDAEAIGMTLPQSARLLVLLRADLARAGHLSEWISSAEALLPEHPGELLAPYTDACLASNSEARLLEHVEPLGALPEHSAEAKRQIAIGRAQLALKAWGQAATAAAKARALSPLDWGVLDFAGQMAFTAGDFAGAEATFRDALSALALVGGRGVDRARLYRQRGEALERLGRVDEAFDEYRRAAELDPDDPWLRQRFATSSPKPHVEARQ